MSADACEGRGVGREASLAVVLTTEAGLGREGVRETAPLFSSSLFFTGNVLCVCPWWMQSGKASGCAMRGHSSRTTVREAQKEARGEGEGEGGVE